MGLTSYHSNKFNARLEGGEKLDYTDDAPLVGIEFECEIDNREDAIDEVEKADFGEVRFYPETDSSLDSTHGVEFVSTPMQVRQAMAHDGPLAKLAKIVADNGERRFREAVGMHVNISANNKEHAWATAALGNSLMDHSRRVGGRSDAYSRHQHDVQDSYGKESAVAMRYRRTKGSIWTCPTTGIRLPNGDQPVEYRNEFRNHRSQASSLRARTQVFYSLLVSRFAWENLAKFEALKALDIPSRHAPMTHLCDQFIAHVEQVSKTNKWAERVLIAMRVGISAIKEAA